MKKLCEDMAMSMYREGRLDREIAEAIGYSRVSVTNWRKSRGLPPNRRRRLEKTLDAYKAAMPLERVQELAQAEKDGRLVVLPCKAGDTVYVLGERRVVECFISEMYLDDQKGIESLVSFTCDSDCDGCPFSNWSQDYSGEYSCSGEYGEASIIGVDFGKTVFLTREEAEAALKKREEADNEAVR